MTSALVLDFDCTLTSTHVFHLLNTDGHYEDKWGDKLIEHAVSPQQLAGLLKGNWETGRDLLTGVMFGGSGRLRSVRFFLEQVRQTGTDIYISSCGRYDQIRRVMEFFQLDNFVTGINASGVPNQRLTGDKHAFITRLVNVHGYGRVYYVDDDPAQHQVLARHRPFHSDRYRYFGENIGLRRDGNGLDCKMMNSILQTVKYKK